MTPRVKRVSVKPLGSIRAPLSESFEMKYIFQVLTFDADRELRNDLNERATNAGQTRSCWTNDRDLSVHDLERILHMDNDILGLIPCCRYNIGSLSRGRNRETGSSTPTVLHISLSLSPGSSLAFSVLNRNIIILLKINRYKLINRHIFEYIFAVSFRVVSAS